MNDALPFSMTLDVRDSCMCLHAQRAARTLARRYDEVLRPHGLTNGQFSLLWSLNRPPPATLPAVAATLGMDRTTVTAMLKPLVRRGLAEVVQDAQDRRGRAARLTPAGHAALAAALPAWRAMQARIEAEISPGEAGRLRQTLRLLAAPPTDAGST